MRYVAAYLLALLNHNNASPSAQDIKDILAVVGSEADDERLNKVIGELKGKNINQLIDSGHLKLSSAPAGGAVGASATAGASEAGAAPAAAAAAVEEEDEKKEDAEESDDDMGFGLFD